MGPAYEIVVAQLTKFREGGGLGISLEGTVDVIDGKEVCPHHYIRSILGDGPVGINGKLQSGDELLEANGKKLLGLNHIEVVSVLKELPIHVRMVCARSLHPGNRQPPSSTVINPTIAYPTFHSSDFDATSMPELNGRDGLTDKYGGSLTSLTPISDRLVKAKSDGSLAVVASTSPELPYNKLKSRSLEPLTGLAMWSSEPQIIELVKGDRGLGFSILDYQDPMNPNETVIVIRSLVPGGVAQQDGRLIPGDRLLFVNDINLENASLDTAVQALKGAPKGVVRIGVAKPLPLPESTQSGQTTEDYEINSLQEFSRKLSIDLPSSLPLIPPLNEDPVQMSSMPNMSSDVNQHYVETSKVHTKEFLDRIAVPICESELKLNNKVEDLTEYNISPLPEALLQTVKIRKGNKPLGINVEITCRGINGILVKSIIKGSSIHKDGHIRAGDYILVINGKSVRNMNEQEASSILKEAENNSEVTIKYIPATDAAIHHQAAILNMQHAEEIPGSSPSPSLPSIPFLPENEILQHPGDIPPSPPTSPPPPLEDEDNSLVDDIKPRASPAEFIQTNNTELDYNKDTETVNKIKEVSYTIPILNFPENKRPLELRSPKPPVPFKPIRKKEDNQISNKLSSIEKQKIVPLNIPEKITASSSFSTFTSNVSRQWGPERTVELWREPTRGLGISIVWGKVDTYPSSGPSTSGIFIKNVLPDSPAGITGSLKRGDRILEVDGYDLREATHNKAVEIIKNAKNPVKFIVQSLISMLSSEEWQSDDILSSEISDDKMQSWEELDIGPAPPPPPRTVSKALHYPQKYKLKKCKEDSEIMSINSNESQFDSDSETKTSLEMEDKDMNFESEYGYSIQEIQKKYGDIKDGEIIIVNLEKGPGGLGLSLAGNKDRHKMSVFVCGMHPNGNAARDGRICIGDELLEVNGIVMYGRCHLNASAMIKGIIGSSYKIVLLRRKNALEEMAVKPLTQFPLCPNDEILEKYSQYRDVRLITVNKGEAGLGIMILEGKHAEAGQGIFVSDMQPNSVARQAGLCVGHMILAVNDTELIGVDYTTAANLLKSIEGLVTLVVSNPHKSSTTSLISNENEDSLDTELPQNDNSLKTDIKKQEKISPPEPPPKPLHLAVKSPSTVAPTIPTSAGCLQHISTSKLSTTPKYKLLPMPPINIDDDALSSSSSSSQETINTQPNPKTCEIIPGQEVTIEICKEKMGLGLSIIGGFDTPLGVVMIHEIYPDGAAAVDGRLIPGDQIMEVNGEDLRTAKHDQAITALRQTPPVVRMVVYREAGLNHEDDLYDILEVELHKKSGRGLGLSIVGRKNGPGVFISEVVKGGIAEANGQLMQGDQILEVNLHDLKNSTQEHAAAILKTTMGKINMKIGRLKAGSRRSTSSSLSSPQLDDNTEMPVQCKNITLQRGPEGLGFSIVGGFNSPHGNLPIYIKNVFEKGAAAEEGSLQQGDQIVAVNHQSLQGMTHEEAVDILKNAKGTVVLTVLK
ncbi:multiple PDZ domain protein-like isoform X2 [Centruroides vittatus]|uniref:multiple PDZ domain protein-like isoform X2 n=1 Tax=Centruroides vittatus TaxID=120091 RepID=UPI00351074F7